MADVKNKRINIYIDQAAAEAALDKLQNKADGFNKKIDDARKQQVLLRQEIVRSEEANRSIQLLQARYDALKSIIEVTVQEQKLNNDALNEAKANIKDYGDKVAITSQKIETLNKKIAEGDEAGTSTLRYRNQLESVVNEQVVFSKKTG